MGPPRKKGTEFVAEMFKKAKEHGAEAVEGSSSGPSTSRTSAFSGTAFKLGSETTPSQKIEEDPSSRPQPPREFVLKMWSNGFSLDDGPLRGFNDPENKEFLQSVMRGSIPHELIREARGGEVHVNMEDHRNEEYVKPKVN